MITRNEERQINETRRCSVEDWGQLSSSRLGRKQRGTACGWCFCRIFSPRTVILGWYGGIDSFVVESLHRSWGQTPIASAAQSETSPLYAESTIEESTCQCISSQSTKWNRISFFSEYLGKGYLRMHHTKPTFQTLNFLIRSPCCYVDPNMLDRSQVDSLYFRWSRLAGASEFYQGMAQSIHARRKTHHTVKKFEIHAVGWECSKTHSYGCQFGSGLSAPVFTKRKPSIDGGISAACPSLLAVTTCINRLWSLLRLKMKRAESFIVFAVANHFWIWLSDYGKFDWKWILTVNVKKCWSSHWASAQCFVCMFCMVIDRTRYVDLSPNVIVVNCTLFYRSSN